MATVHWHYPSFNAGELSPLLGARFGVEKVLSGCRRLRNFIIHPHGPAFRRPGMEFRGKVLDETKRSRLIGFNYSTTTGYVLEIGPSAPLEPDAPEDEPESSAASPGMAVWANGERVAVVNLEFPYAQGWVEGVWVDEFAEVQVTQVNDVCYLAHPNHAPRKLERESDTSWKLSTIEWKWPALGDENVRKLNKATPTHTLIAEFPAEKWPQATALANGAHTLAVTAPNLTAAQKTMSLYQLSGATRTRLATVNWTTVAPAALVRNLVAGRRYWLVYFGPPKADSTLHFTGPSDLDVTVPLNEQRPLIEQVVTVPKGDWEVTIVNEGPEVVTGSMMTIETKVKGVWKTVKTLVPVSNGTARHEGAYLDQDTEVRLEWFGQGVPAGVVRINKVERPVSTETTLQVNGVSPGNDFTMTATTDLFTAKHLGSYWQIAHRRTDYDVQITPTSATTTASSPGLRVIGKWEVFTHGLWYGTLHLERELVGSPGTWEIIRSWNGNGDRTINASGEEDGEGLLRLRFVRAGAEPENARFILEAADALVYGLVQVTTVTLAPGQTTTDSVKVKILKSLYSSMPTAMWTEGAWSDENGHPRTLALHGGRLWFAGTAKEPQRVWGSVVNDFENFQRTSLDDSGISFTPAATESNQIKWMISHDEDLILGTAGEEWTASSEKGIIRPSDLIVRRRSNYGSRNVPALLINESVVFLQRGGRKLRQLTPRTDLTAWSAADLTVLAEHVAQTGIVQMVAMRNPLSILWAVTADGRLLGMTYEQEQNVFGWHVHETEGVVESVAVVEGADVDEVWLAVRRGERRTIERFDPRVIARAFDEPAHLIYLDAAVRQESPTPLTLMNGLEHLEGREVAILGDGAQQSPRVVLNGAVDLETPAKVVIVGLPFTSELQPMRIDLGLRDGTAQHRQFRVSRVGLLLHESLGGEIADGPGERFEKILYRRASTPMDEPPPLYSGEVETAIESRVRPGVDVIVRQTAPLPLNVAAITCKLDVYGE